MARLTGKNMGKYIKSYKIFEKHSYYERQMEIINSYYDCFVDLMDMGMCIYLVVGHSMYDIKGQKKIEDIISRQGDSPYCADGLTFEIRGFIHHEYENNPEALRDIYNFLSKNLKGLEDRFTSITKTRIETISASVTTGYKSQTREIDFIKRRKEEWIWNELINRAKLLISGNKYNFVDIPEDKEITNLSIVHWVKF